MSNLQKKKHKKGAMDEWGVMDYLSLLLFALFMFEYRILILYDSFHSTFFAFNIICAVYGTVMMGVKLYKGKFWLMCMNLMIALLYLMALGMSIGQT